MKYLAHVLCTQRMAKDLFRITPAMEHEIIEITTLGRGTHDNICEYN